MTESAKAVALARLGMARQFELDEGTQEVYLDELQDETDEDVTDACRLLARQPRAEFDTTFPSLGAVLNACQQARENRRAAATRQLLARAPKALPLERPAMSRDEAREWIRRFKDAVSTKRITKSTTHRALKVVR